MIKHNITEYNDKNLLHRKAEYAIFLGTTFECCICTVRALMHLCAKLRVP